MKLKLALFLALCCIGTNVQADSHHKAFWKFLKGEWTYEIEVPDQEVIRGKAVWRLTAKQAALVGRFVEEDGSRAVEIAGWRPDTKAVVLAGYGSKGNYWHMEFKDVTAESSEGQCHGILEDGRTIDGVFVGKKLDDDHYRWDFTGKTGDGEEIEMTGKYTRMAE